MAFQRSYSKVWWGSDDNQLPVMMNGMNPAKQHLLNQTTGSLANGELYSYFSQQQEHPRRKQRSQAQQHYHLLGGSTYHSLDLNHYKSLAGNLSHIQEVDDENNLSKMSWEKHDSPGSLRSQDSGFSDNEEFQCNRSLRDRSPKKSSPSSKSDKGSPTSVISVQTPPTVIRRVANSEFYTPLVNVSRRISFSCSASPNKNIPAAEEMEGPTLMEQLDSMQLITESPLARKLDFDDTNSTLCDDVCDINPRVKRRRKVQRKVTSPLSPAHKRLQKANDGLKEENSNFGYSVTPKYNNETVYLCGEPTCSTPPPAYNNDTIILGGPSDSSHNNVSTLEQQLISPLHLHQQFRGNTSTPKQQKFHTPACTLPPIVGFHEYDNSLLNGHTEDVQSWLDGIRISYDQEVMSTLQTKSIAQEAFKNLQITTNTVAKFIRQLQQKALSLQSSFERVERILSSTQNAPLHDAIFESLQLLKYVSEFSLILERRTVFFSDSRSERKRYEDYLDQIRLVNKDTRYSLENQHYINFKSLLEDLQVLKRILLISVQNVYEKLIRIIVLSIENGRCDLMLKANINMIATLMNIDYDGFASLTKAFVETDAVRTLLVICLDHKLTSVRAQALRALATVCSSPEPIAQLCCSGGIEIIRDILEVDGSKNLKNIIKRGELEKREAVSLLTQITAAWHGPDHKLSGIKSCVETIVEGLTQLLIFTDCTQTLLLCTAALNNLSRMEITSHYSIMSHETIFKLISIMEQRDKSINVFLSEQIVDMLYNMCLNKKCHSHLANAGIINFITYTYKTEFYKCYNSRGETEAQKRCIKTILHTLTRLVQDSVLGMELFQQQKHLPSSIIFKLNSTQDAKQQLSSQVDDFSYSSRGVSFLPYQLLQQTLGNKNEHLQQQLNQETAEKGKNLKIQLQRQESYV